MKKNFKQGQVALLTMVAVAASFTTVNANESGKNSIRYIVGFKDNNMQQSEKILKSIKGGEIQLRLVKDNAFAINLPEQAANNLINNPLVAYIEKDQPVQLTSQTVPYSIPMIQADQISDANSANIKICVIDTGVQVSHEDFAGANISGTADPKAGAWNQPENSHGTYMIGGIVAMNNNIGVLGAMPNGYVQIHSHKLPYGGGGNWSSQVAYGVDACVDNNSHIISMSLTAGETRAFSSALERAHAAGSLIIASAGNDGDTSSNYPAESDLVMSVSAVDKNKKFAPYSNQHATNEIAAPGSAVLGTEMMGNGRLATVVINGDASYEPIAVPAVNASQSVTGTITGNATGTLVNCGIADTVCAGAAGNICLIEATDINITSQVLNCQNGGGVGVIAYNASGSIQYDGRVDENATSIPASTISVDESIIALSQVGQAASLEVAVGNYTRAFGTSLSSPKVAASAALAWSYHPTCTNEQIRNALNMSAEDLGVTGRDDQFGYGLVQAAAAKAYLDANPCNVVPVGIQLSSNVTRSKGKWYLDLSWTGSTAASMDIYRDNVVVTTVANTGAYTEQLTQSGTFVYKVCDAGTTDCSNEETVTR